MKFHSMAHLYQKVARQKMSAQLPSLSSKLQKLHCYHSQENCHISHHNSELCLLDKLHYMLWYHTLSSLNCIIGTLQSLLHHLGESRRILLNLILHDQCILLKFRHCLSHQFHMSHSSLHTHIKEQNFTTSYTKNQCWHLDLRSEQPESNL